MNSSTLKSKISRLYRKLGTWEDVGNELGITGGMAYRIANDEYEPHDAHIRERLGLPVLALTPVCAKCGQVHTTKRCTANDKPAQGKKWVRVPGHAGGEWQ